MPPSESEKLNFVQSIETIVVEKELTYIEAIIHFCEQNSVEELVAATLITPGLKSKLEEQAIELNLIKGRRNKLPL